GPVGTSIASTANITNNATVILNSSAPITVGGAITGTGTVIQAGTGTSSVAGRIAASSLAVNAGSLTIGAKVTPNSAARTSVVGNLTIGAGGVMDLTNNSMVIDYTSPIGTQVSDVQGHLRSGRLITSSATATTRLGYGDNAILGKTSFGGVSVDSSSVLIKY